MPIDLLVLSLKVRAVDLLVFVSEIQNREPRNT